MMCARLLKHTPEEQQGRFFRTSGRVFDTDIAFYGRTLQLGPRAPAEATLVVAVGTLVLTIVLYMISAEGFFPR